MEQKKKSAFLKVLFVLYVLGVLFILFFARVNRGELYHWELFSEEHLADRLQCIPFATVHRFWVKLNAQSINLQFVVRNIAVNLLLFVPMGAMLPMLFPKRFGRFWKTILFIVLFVFILEILQFLTFYGSADVDDLIFNTFGAAVGYFLYYMGSKIKKSSSHS